MPTAPPSHRPHKTRAPKHGVERDRQKRRAMNTGSRHWRNLRALVLTEERYLCRMCGRFGDHVDHINGHADQWEDYRRDNLQCLCRACHSAKTMREQNASGAMGQWTR